MGHKQELDHRVRGLERAGADIVVFDTEEAFSADHREVIELMGKHLPPPPILRFFEDLNGTKLAWSAQPGGQPVQGSLNIPTVVASAMRATGTEGGEPLEGVLWHDELDGEVLAQLKRMTIFEAIAGTSDHLCFFHDDPSGRLYLVQDDEVTPLVPDFDTAIGVLIGTCGAGEVRTHLTQRDWQARIEADPAVRWVRRQG